MPPGNPGMGLGLQVFTLFMFLFYVGLFGLLILSFYTMISAIRFFKKKTRNDEELIQKIDELIKVSQKL